MVPACYILVLAHLPKVLVDLLVFLFVFASLNPLTQHPVNLVRGYRSIGLMDRSYLLFFQIAEISLLPHPRLAQKCCAWRWIVAFLLLESFLLSEYGCSSWFLQTHVVRVVVSRPRDVLIELDHSRVICCKSLFRTSFSIISLLSPALLYHLQQRIALFLIT